MSSNGLPLDDSSRSSSSHVSGSPCDPVIEEFILLLDQHEDKKELVSEFCGRHPRCAEEIKATFEQQQRLDSVADTEAFVKLDREPVASLPESFNDFRRVHKIAEGGMGVIYKAWQESLQRWVAIKTLSNPDARARFNNEQRCLAQFNLATVVALYETGEWQGMPFLVMPFVDGAALNKVVVRANRQLLQQGSRGVSSTLGDLARESPNSSEAADDDKPLKPTPSRLGANYLHSVVRCVIDVARAIQESHNLGIVHRDLKPENVMVNTLGRAFIIDFGLASPLDPREAEASAPASSEQLAQLIASGVLGTPSYMAPEQFGGNYTTATDVWGIGTILYELLAFGRAFKDIDREHVPESPRSMNSAVPKDLDAIAMKCLELNSEYRYESADEVAEDLERWMQHVPVIARPPRIAERLGKWSRRHPAIAATILFVMIATVGLLVHNQRLAKFNTELGEKHGELERAIDRIAEEKEETERQRGKAVDALVFALTRAEEDAVPQVTERLTSLGEVALPKLRLSFADASLPFEQRLHLAHALSAFGDVQSEFLVANIPNCSPSQSRNVAEALMPVREEVSGQLLELTTAAESGDDRIRFAAVLLALGNYQGIERVFSLEADRNTRTTLIHSFSTWCWNWAQVRLCLTHSDDPGTRSALCLAIATLDGSGFPPELRDELETSLLDVFQGDTNGGVHNAANWALRQMKAPRPEIAASDPPSVDQDWFVNRTGMTMLRIPTSQFRPATPLVRGFFISDREATVAQFKGFIEDKNYPSAEKPVNWQKWRSSVLGLGSDTGIWGPDPRKSPSEDCPVQEVNVVDAILFCNWLSKCEGREPCYSRSEYNWTYWDEGRLVSTEGWSCDFDRDGYRLPTQWEWRNAAAAGATPYFFGSDGSLLRHYAWFNLNTKSRTQPCGSLMPNPYGLFDVFGNVKEWTWDRTVPEGMWSSPGGSWEGDQTYNSFGTLFFHPPLSRNNKLGFRVACSDTSAQPAFDHALAELEGKASQDHAKGLAKTYEALGDLARDGQQWGTASAWYNKAIDTLQVFLPEKQNYFAAGQLLEQPYSKRAALFEQLGRYAEAIDDWEMVLDVERAPKATTTVHLLLAGRKAVLAGLHDPAFQAVSKIHSVSSREPLVLYNAARVAALCAKVVTDEGKPAELQSMYSKLATELLQSALAQGFNDFARLKHDTDLHAIRDQGGFQELLQSQIK